MVTRHKTPSVINRSQVRKFALDYAQKRRPDRFSRVSPEFLEYVEARVHEVVRQRVDAHPSLGKTLR